MRSLMFAIGVAVLVLSMVPVFASNASSELPFINDGANRPVLDTLTPDVPAPEMQNMDEDFPPNAVVPAPEMAHDTHEKKEAGLPQFDYTTFPKQVFWLAIVFAFLYVVYGRKILPTISSVIENRRERVASDLRAAEDLKKEVEHVRGEYEAAIAEAQMGAQQMILDLQDDIKRKIEAEDKAFKTRADQSIEALEGRIAESRARLLGELNGLAAELTVDISKTVANITVDKAAASALINDITDKAEAA